MKSITLLVMWKVFRFYNLRPTGAAAAAAAAAMSDV